ncbi:MAG: MFS transporter [Corynebacterium sp.]|nr:MFS transporter [Corynebacterium sp.]
MKRRVALASTIGTTIEFYDFYVYATAAVAVFPYLFFPKTDNSTVALLQSFATFGLAFIARPLGSIIFGHFGDRIGRKATLVGSLLTMGIATFLIGCLPTYSQIGILAPALLALLRFCQGLGLGGEWSGAALLATETADSKRRAWAAMWPQLGAPFGFIIANVLFLFLVTVLNHETGSLTGNFITWGWRIPFLLSSVLVVVGLVVRFKLEETPVFTEAVKQGKKVKAPLGEVFRTSWKPLILGTFVMISCYTLFYLVTTWVLSYGIAKKDNPNGVSGLGIKYMDFLEIQILTIILFAVSIPISAIIADCYGRRVILITVSVLMIIYGFSFGYFLNPETADRTSVTIFLFIGMFLMGLVFGPMSAVLPELFPTNVRYTGSGISYNIASILGAAIAPFVATALVASHGVQSVGIYLIIVTVISLISILLMKETKSQEMTSI